MSIETNTVLKVQDIKKRTILNGISFDINKGEMVAVMGPSGSGKSTLLYNVSGMDRADSGISEIDGVNIISMTEEEKSNVRLKKIGFVFQNMNMLSNLTIKENIMYPAFHLKSDGKNKKKINKKEIEEQADKLMNMLGITELADRKITEVSGGQLQRACICRSMINSPSIIFADEPTGALNKSSSEDVMDAFKSVNESGTTILLVTHDSKVAAACNRILYLVDGKIVGELFVTDCDNREKTVSKWLENMGW